MTKGDEMKNALKKIGARLIAAFVLLAIGDQLMLNAFKEYHGMNRLFAELPGIALIMASGIVLWNIKTTGKREKR